MRPAQKPSVSGPPITSSATLPARMMRSPHDSPAPYFSLMGASRRLDLSAARETGRQRGSSLAACYSRALPASQLPAEQQQRWQSVRGSAGQLLVCARERRQSCNLQPTQVCVVGPGDFWVEALAAAFAAAAAVPVAVAAGRKQQNSSRAAVAGAAPLMAANKKSSMHPQQASRSHLPAQCQAWRTNRPP